MNTVKSLILLELNGFGVNNVDLKLAKHGLQFRMAVLELRAFQIAGKQFNLSSPREIDHVSS